MTLFWNAIEIIVGTCIAAICVSVTIMLVRGLWSIPNE